MDRQPDYLVTLRPLADGAPATIRLRRFLKMALRTYGLRAVAVEEVQQQPAPVQAPAPPAPGADVRTSDPTARE